MDDFITIIECIVTYHGQKHYELMLSDSWPCIHGHYEEPDHYIYWTEHHHLRLDGVAIYTAYIHAIQNK